MEQTKVTAQNNQDFYKNLYQFDYIEKNLKRIVEYCQKDVATLAQLYLKMKGDLGFNADEINYL